MVSIYYIIILESVCVCVCGGGGGGGNIAEMIEDII